MTSPLERVIARRLQAWSAYGRAVHVDRTLVDLLSHSVRSWGARRLIAADVARRLRRPVAPSLEADVRQALASLPMSAAESWLVHRRPTGRLVVHEIDAHGRLLSVVKVGPEDDIGMAREVEVLTSLADARPATRLVIPSLIGSASDSGRRSMRTRLMVPSPARPPYAWNEALLEATARALKSLHEALESGGVTEPSHGDFTAWNLFAGSDGSSPVVGVIDFEEAGRWPLSWDAARFVTTAAAEGRLRGDAADAARRAFGLTGASLHEYHSATSRARDRG